MQPDDRANPSGSSTQHPDQPPSSDQPDSSARSTGQHSDTGAAGDSATAAQRAMKQTSKTVQEDGTDRP